MSKLEYLRRLENELKGKISTVELDDIIRDYAEYFEEGKKQGKTEDEISQSLGIPFSVAQQILAEKAASTHQRMDFSADFSKDSFSAGQGPMGTPHPYSPYPPRTGRPQRTYSTMTVILMVIAIVGLVPIVIPIVTGLCSTLLKMLTGGAVWGLSSIFSWTSGILFDHHLPTIASVAGIVVGLAMLAISVTIILGICLAVRSIYRDLKGPKI